MALGPWPRSATRTAQLDLGLFGPWHRGGHAGWQADPRQGHNRRLGRQETRTRDILAPFFPTRAANGAGTLS